MGFPSSGFEGLYRNPLSQVQAFLTSRHGDAYQVYNLCSSASTALQFANVGFPFEDHAPCAFRMLVAMLAHIGGYLRRGPPGAAVAIHCKAGKGRTGLVCASYLLHARRAHSARDALALYGQRRTLNGKGVTIPSQARYVGYYERFLRWADARRGGRHAARRRRADVQLGACALAVARVRRVRRLHAHARRRDAAADDAWREEYAGGHARDPDADSPTSSPRTASGARCGCTSTRATRATTRARGEPVEGLAQDVLCCGDILVSSCTFRDGVQAQEDVPLWFHTSMVDGDGGGALRRCRDALVREGRARQGRKDKKHERSTRTSASSRARARRRRPARRARARGRGRRPPPSAASAISAGAPRDAPRAPPAPAAAYALSRSEPKLPTRQPSPQLGAPFSASAQFTPRTAHFSTATGADVDAGWRTRNVGLLRKYSSDVSDEDDDDELDLAEHGRNLLSSVLG